MLLAEIVLQVYRVLMSETDNRFRTEHDSMGEIEVPAEAYYGAQTQRAVENFPISGRRLSRGFIAALGMIKHAAAEANNVTYHVGNIFSADLFYTPDPAMFETLAKYDVLGVEMEAAGMYPIAAEYGAEALAICTVSDDIRTGEALSSADRATTFDEMILVALETVRASD